MRSVLAIVAIAAILVYAGICWFLHVKQRDMLYYGWTTTVDAAATDFAVKRPDATLRGWALNPSGSDPILYFGGNAEPVEYNREAFAQLFPGRSVYFLAYRGYGASEGAPSQAALVPDAIAFFDEVQRRHPGQKIAVIGRSLGSGVASQLAAQRPVERLALVTPFDSMVATARSHYPIIPVSWLLNERYESDQALKTYDRPVLIVHGGRDDVVPEANTLGLIRALPKPPTVVRIANADHNDISGYPEFVVALSEFLSR